MKAEEIREYLLNQRARGDDGLFSNAVLLKGIRNIGNSEVYKVFLDDGTTVLLKTYCHNSWLIRELWGPWNLRNEACSLEKMRHYVRVPEVYGFVGKDTLAIEFLDKASVLHSEDHCTHENRPPKSFFLELIHAMDVLHENGICHGDLRRANVMIDEETHPCIIDVATACFKNGRGGCIRRRFFEMAVACDNFTLARLVSRYYPELLDDRLKGWLCHVPWYLWLGRFFRKKIYRKLHRRHRRIKH